MKKRFKKYLSIVTIISVMFMQVSPIIVFAEEAESTPTPTQQATDNSQLAPVSSTPESSNTVASPTPSVAPNLSQPPTTEQRSGPLSDAEREQRKAEAKAVWEQTYFAVHPEHSPSTTGNATNSTSGVTSGNNNGSTTSPQNPTSGSGSSATNVGNGASSNNSSNLTNSAAVDTGQTNSAKVGNNVNQTATTGKSSTSFNVGDSTLTTGDANVSGTAITGVNTNLSNVQVSEFNVVDNQKGDLVLSPEAFAANCISGCSPLLPSDSAKATTDKSGFEGQAGNGANSTNTANSQNTTNTNTAQTNSATTGNNLTLTANSGDNTGSFNTDGNTIINTGDANISANSLTFANNNLAGGVTFGVVNIYGNLEGDIILPEFSSNGALSTNSTSSDSTNNTNTFQNNDVTIANNVTIDGTTGNNSSSDNTNGNTTVNTGKTATDTNVLNIANTNITDGTWWLVLVNEAGNWVGKLLGGPDGAKMAGSAGTEFKTDANGQVTATNGSASGNTTNVSSITNTDTTQNNNAAIENNLNLSANTGGNKTDFNTGGHNTITTGDTNTIANLVNFVNNNISGNGKLIVTVVNVFGTWFGDFVTPGQQKQNTPLHPSDSAKATTDKSGSEGQEIVSSPSDSEGAVQNTNTIGENNSSSQNQNSEAEGVMSGFQTTPENAVQNSGSGDVKVAGVSTAVTEKLSAVAGSHERIIKINLAWILLLLPLVAFALFRKRQMFMRFWKKP